MNEAERNTKDTYFFRLLSLRGRLQLEIRGMKGRYPRTTYSIIKKEFKLRGSRISVLDQFNSYIEMLGEARAGLRHIWAPNGRPHENPAKLLCLCDLPYNDKMHVCLAHESEIEGDRFKCICSERI